MQQTMRSWQYWECRPNTTPRGSNWQRQGKELNAIYSLWWKLRRKKAFRHPHSSPLLRIKSWTIPFCLHQTAETPASGFLASVLLCTMDSASGISSVTAAFSFRFQANTDKQSDLRTFSIKLWSKWEKSSSLWARCQLLVTVHNL